MALAARVPIEARRVLASVAPIAPVQSVRTTADNSEILGGSFALCFNGVCSNSDATLLRILPSAQLTAGSFALTLDDGLGGAAVASTCISWDAAADDGSSGSVAAAASTFLPSGVSVRVRRDLIVRSLSAPAGGVQLRVFLIDSGGGLGSTFTVGITDAGCGGWNSGVGAPAVSLSADNVVGVAFPADAPADALEGWLSLTHPDVSSATVLRSLPVLGGGYIWTITLRS